MIVRFTLLGEPASKSNSRKIVKIAGRPASIKSDKARGFEASALKQIPPACRVQFASQVAVSMRIYYASERPDLDESLILDILQDRFVRVNGLRVLVQKGVYKNDRLVREKHIYHGIDKLNPRVEIDVYPITKAGHD